MRDNINLASSYDISMQGTFIKKNNNKRYLICIEVRDKIYDATLFFHCHFNHKVCFTILLKKSWRPFFAHHQPNVTWICMCLPSQVIPSYISSNRGSLLISSHFFLSTVSYWTQPFYYTPCPWLSSVEQHCCPAHLHLQAYSVLLSFMHFFKPLSLYNNQGLFVLSIALTFTLTFR